MDSQTFTLFPELPSEIRIKIWDAITMLELRIVEVCLTESFGSDHRNAPFYTPTKVPKSLFSINQESRSIALQNYPLSFPNRDCPAHIRWNPFIDTIFLPAWCFQYQCIDFQEAISEEEKGMIQKLAFEMLIWTGCAPDGEINSFIQIDGFPNLREVILVLRLLDETGCGCCHEFDGPEEGVAGFRGLGDDGSDGDEELKEEAGEASLEEAVDAIGTDATEGESENEENPVQERKWLTQIEECMALFITLHENNRRWRIPSIREVDLTRDGVLI